MQPERLRCESPGQRPGPDLQHTSSPCKGDIMCGTQPIWLCRPFRAVGWLFQSQGFALGYHIAAFQAAEKIFARCEQN